MGATRKKQGNKHSKICSEILERQLQMPITSNKEAWRMLENLATCFLAVSRTVDNLCQETYGNGTPGGIKQDVSNIHLTLGNMQKSLELLVPGNNDKFSLLLKWLGDKVLPPVVTTGILALLYLIFGTQ